MNQQKKEILQSIYNHQWASIHEVRKTTRFSRDAINRTFVELTEKGYINCRKETGRHGANEYRVSEKVLPAVITAKLT
jgi:predicted transcriptional regulator